MTASRRVTLGMGLGLAFWLGTVCTPLFSTAGQFHPVLFVLAIALMAWGFLAEWDDR